MNVIGKELLDKAKRKYQDAAKALDGWLKVAENTHWNHFMEVKETYGSASNVDGHVIFNIRGNNYRLITVFRFPFKIIVVRSFLTHDQYDDKSNWDKGIL
jgi:mRNA interferase HigB